MNDQTSGDRVFQYEVVPVMITRGAAESEAGNEWATLRAGLNERGRAGFRVVAVSEGPEGRAVIMEREVPSGHDARRARAAAAARSVSEAADAITRESVEGEPRTTSDAEGRGREDTSGLLPATSPVQPSEDAATEDHDGDVPPASVRGEHVLRLALKEMTHRHERMMRAARAAHRYAYGRRDQDDLRDLRRTLASAGLEGPKRPGSEDS